MAQTIEKATLFAPDINCGHCEQHIRKDVTKLPGIQSVSASPATKMVEIEFDPSQTSVESIKSVMWAAGYPAREMTDAADGQRTIPLEGSPR